MVLGVAPETALGDELEAGGLDLAAQRALLDPMQGLADRGAVAGLGGMCWMGCGVFIMAKMVNFEI